MQQKETERLKQEIENILNEGTAKTRFFFFLIIIMPTQNHSLFH